MYYGTKEKVTIMAVATLFFFVIPLYLFTWMAVVAVPFLLALFVLVRQLGPNTRKAKRPTPKERR